MQHLFLNDLASLPPTLCADNEHLPFSDAVFPLEHFELLSLSALLCRLPFCSQRSSGVSTSVCLNGTSPVFPYETHHFASVFNLTLFFLKWNLIESFNRYSEVNFFTQTMTLCSWKAAEISHDRRSGRLASIFKGRHAIHVYQQTNMYSIALPFALFNLRLPPVFLLQRDWQH